MRQDDKQLRMGDKVLWRGGFGHQPLLATVTGMAITESAPIGRSLTLITATGHMLSKYKYLDKNRSAVSERNNIRINNYM